MDKVTTRPIEQGWGRLPPQGFSLIIRTNHSFNYENLLTNSIDHNEQQHKALDLTGAALGHDVY